ncbi:MAG TPA: MFS transporter [Actinophytocola sp.]|uniref:MFS transporter n=1 Tax=Actinophytocola sp. TaxID=1872138 RepID=UPI002DDC98CF|nr:MFS transporter [Actinophytocola sp.]HEV2778344.1 MFS transporter [Actinophytocola sp.]
MEGQPRAAVITPVTLAVAGIVLVAATMRGPFTSVGPLLETIRSDLRLSAVAAGALGMLPLLAFAAVSPVAPAVGRRLGLERSLGLALVVLAVGVLLRSAPGAVAPFAGTALIGIAIGLVNVLLSGLIKRDYPDRAAALTGLYTTTMGAFAMIGSGVAVPVADAAPGGWRTSLGLWVVVAVIALVAWLPRLRRPEPRPAGSADRPAGRTHWRSPLAWQLTAFMGLQSLGFYVAVSWLPTILLSTGVSMAAAGWYLALMQLTGLVASALSPPIVRRLPDQRLFTAGAAVLGVLSYLGFVVAPDLGLVWSATVGLSQGVGITLALSFFALRARDAGQAAALSGMGQSLGYLLAALGPLLFGVLHDATGGWSAPLVILAALIGVQAVVALGAGRARKVA